jgi:hypothetical protein
MWMKLECGFGCVAANFYSPTCYTVVTLGGALIRSRLVLSGVG